MAFDLQGAREAGHSDSDIVDYLAAQYGFDVTKARADGYSDTEIANHLGAPATQSRMPSIKAAQAKRSENYALSEAARFGNRAAAAADDRMSAELSAPVVDDAPQAPRPRRGGTRAEMTFTPTQTDMRRVENQLDALPQQRGSLLDRPMVEPGSTPFTEAEGLAGSVAPWKSLEDARARRPYQEAKPLSVAQELALDARDLSRNPVYRGALSGVSELGKVGVGAVRAGADLVGADGLAGFAGGASRAATQMGDAAGQGLSSNEKLVADVTSSIINSAPSLAMGMAGGPALRTLFATSAANEYNAGRDAGFGAGESAARAGIMGMAEALGERFGFPQQIALLKGMAKNLPADQMAKVFGNMLMQEVPGEQLTTAMQFLADKIGPAALNPNATVEDYLKAAGETLKVTLGQSAVMGGGPAAINSTRQALRRADATTMAPEQRIAGEIDAAAPEMPTPAQLRSEHVSRLEDFGAQHGIKPTVLKAIKDATASVPLDELPQRTKAIVSKLVEKGLIQAPADEQSLSVLDSPAITGLAEDAAPAPEVESDSTPAPTLATPETVSGAPINRNWSEFSAESGTLGVPRDQMPQIPNRGALVQFLNARGIPHQVGMIPAEALKPTQAEFSPQKVQGYDSTRSILVSADGHILDGHHAWLAALQDGQPVNAIQFGAPIQDLLRLAHQLPSSTTAPGPRRQKVEQQDVGSNVAGRDGGAGLPDAGGAGGDRGVLGQPGRLDANAAAAAPAADGGARAGDAGPGRGNDALKAAQADAQAAIKDLGAIMGAQTNAPQAGGPRVIFRAGRTPNAAVDVDVRPNDDGTITPHMEGEPLLDYDSGEPLRLPATADVMTIKKAIRDAGAVTGKTNFYAVRGDGNASKAETRAHQKSGADANVSDMERRQGSMPQPEGDGVQQVRRSGSDSAPAVGGELQQVPSGGRGAAQQESQPGSDRRDQGLPAGQRPVGNQVGAKPQSVGGGGVGAPRGEAPVGRMGGTEGSSSNDDQIPPAQGLDGSRRSGDAGSASAGQARKEVATEVFRTFKAAEKAKAEAGNTVKIQKTNGGYKLRQMSDKGLAAAQEFGQRAKRSGVDVTKDSLSAALGKLGGINRASASRDLGVHKDSFAKAGRVGKPTFPVNGGMTAEAAVESMVEFGYLLPGQGLTDLESKLQDDLVGSPQYSMSYEYAVETSTDQEPEADAEARAEREAIMAENDLSREQMNALRGPDTIEAEDPAWELMPGADTRESVAASMRQMGFTDQEIANELAERFPEPRSAAAPSPAQAGQDEPVRPEAADGARAEAARDQAAGQEDGAEKALSLEAQSEADLKAKAEREQAAEAAAKAKRAAEQERLRKEAEQRDNKARADQTVDAFELGQSADQQMSGMGDLFAQPAAAPAPSKSDTLFDRAKRADGRSVPVEGDDVYMEAAGAFGMPASVSGVVVRGSGGALRVKITGARGMLGETTSQKYAELTSDWTLKGEESGASRRRREQAEKLQREETARRAEYEAARTEAAARNGTLDIGKVKLGDVIETPDGQLEVVAETDDGGAIYVRPIDDGGEAPRGIGSDLRGYKARPDIKLPADGTQIIRRAGQDQALFADGWQDVKWNEGAERFERVNPGSASASKQAKRPGIQVEKGDSEAIRQAKADALKALGDLGDLLSSGARLNMLPEQEQKLVPVLTRLMDAAFRLGYLKFKEAARWAREQVRNALGDDIANELTLQHWQGAYIGMSGRYTGQGVDGIMDVAKITSLDQLDEQENADASVPATDLAGDRQDAADQPAAVEAPDAGGRPAAAADEAGGEARGDGGRRPDDPGFLAGGPASGRVGSDQPVRGEDRADGPEELPAGDQQPERGSDPRGAGVQADPVADDAVEEAAADLPDNLKRQAAQRAAESIEHKPGDLDNIRATLPYLLPAQQEDVFKAEKRFAAPDGYGMLLTNGTGTGKTFSGLGVVKRFARQGKTNQLIVVPDAKIMADWVDSAKALGLTITPLAGTKDAGKGIVITTYANAEQNNELVSREWDHVLADEAHQLMQGKDGESTGALNNLRALTWHPDGWLERYSRENVDDIAKAKALSKEIDSLNRLRNLNDTMDVMRDDYAARIAKLEDELRPINKKLIAARNALQEKAKTMTGLARPRATFLSATPFAYDKTVDWAEGYLFSYAEGYPHEGRQGGYNTPSPQAYFFMTHFGYRMKNGKLTKPDARVDSGLMQRQFNGWLKKRGALSNRTLDVKPDYDRRFVMLDSAVGNRIDEALKWIGDMATAERASNRERGGEAPAGFSALSSVLSDQLYGKDGHLVRRYLLEAIKAKEVVPIIKQHLAMGRKVVVFHDFKKGGSKNPFALTPVPQSLVDAGLSGGDDGSPEYNAAMRSKAYNEALAQFRAKFPELVGDGLLSGLISPIERFRQELPGTLMINGDEKPRDVLRRYKEFQDDATGPVVALVQSAKNKGWSGHDTTGKHQRVLINLGLPTQPTMTIQQEGRIYRLGVISNAIIRYLNTGTNWERTAFAQTIAQRSSEAENLGQGEAARALRESYVAAFEEADAFPPGHDGEGTGGKERDQLSNAALTEYDRAKAFYWSTQKKNAKTKAQEGNDYFATPEPVGLKLVQWLRLRGGEAALEPSAGHGAIARWFPENVERTAIEPSMVLRSKLALSFGDGKIVDSDFESLNVVNKYDGIAMNPPFGTAGRMAIDHLAKAATHLREGGRIAAIIPTGPAADKKFDAWFYEEQQRKINPLASVTINGKEQPIYRGATVTSRASWAPKATILRKVDGADSFWVKVDGSPGETTVTAAAITGIEKQGPTTEMFRPAEGLHLVGEVKLPGVTFERAGTGVMTRVVIIERTAKGVEAPQARRIDMTGVEGVNELFDRLEDIEMPERTKPDEGVREATTQNQRRDENAQRDQARVEGAQLAEQQGVEIVEHTTGKGKLLKGVIRKDLNASQAGSIDKFTFRKNGGYFIRLEHLAKLNEKFPAPAAVSEPGAAYGDKTQTPEFRRWFGDSKVVDAQGEPLVVYHGSKTDTGPKFNPAKSRIAGAFFFAADPQFASSPAYTGYEGQSGNVSPVYLSLRNPKVMASLSSNPMAEAAVIEAAKADGFDGIVVEKGGRFIAFRPEQIKSALGNDGTFDANDPSIVSEGGSEYDAEAPRRKYQDDRQLDLFNQQLDAFTGGQPDPSQAGPGIAGARQAAADALRVLRADGTLLGRALSSGLAENQRANLVGQVARTPEDLATLAQAYRDPRFETFRVVFTGARGRIVAQVGLTQRLPGSTSAIVGEDLNGYLAQLFATAKKVGATGFYMLHNHPSGSAESSDADRLLTQNFARLAEAGGALKFQGHVVIDTNQYSVIDRLGTSIMHFKDFGAQAPFTDAGEWGSYMIDSPQKIMEMAKKLDVDDGAVTLIVMDNQHKVKHITAIPASTVAGSKERMLGAIRRATLQATGSKIVAVSRDQRVAMKVAHHALDSFLITADGAVTSVRSITGLYGDVMPRDRSVRVTADTSPAFDYLRPLALQQEMLRRKRDSLMQKRFGGRVAEPDSAYKADGSHLSDAERAAFEKAGFATGRQTLGARVRGSFDRAMDALRSKDAAWAEFRTGALDSFYGIRQAAMRSELGNLPVDQDPYITARLANGGTSGVLRAVLLHGQAQWAANGQHLEKKLGTKGLLQILEPLAEDTQDFFAWMVGNRAKRLKAEGRENNFSDADIAALQGRGKGKELKFAKVAVEYAAWKRSLLDVAEAAGLIDGESRKSWDHADYIPFYRQLDKSEGNFNAVAAPGMGRKGLSGQSSGIRTLRGGEAALNDPIENLLMNASRLLDASLKNNAIAKTIRTVGEPSGLAVKVGYDFKPASVPRDQIRKELIRAGTPPAVLDAIPDEAITGMSRMMSIVQPRDPDVVRVMFGGRPEFYRIDDPHLLRALTSFVPFDFPGLDLMRFARRLLTRTVTSTPEFMLRNWIRDSLSAQAITKGFNPMESIMGAVKSYRKTGAAEAMLFAGASFQSGHVQAGDPKETGRSLRRMLRAKGMPATAADGSATKVTDTILRGAEHYFEIGDAIENANREAVYAATSGRTGNLTAAAYEAKDLMDFSLRGGWAGYQLAADVLPFFNARVQGLYRLGRSDPKRLALVGSMMMVASLLLAVANNGEDWYDELPDWDKDANWHFRIGGKHYRLPKPFEVGVAFATVPERMLRYGMNQPGVRQLVNAMRAGMGKAPVTGSAGADSGKKFAGRVLHNVKEQLSMNPTPQLVAPALDVYMNWNSFQERPIDSAKDEKLLAHRRFSQSTSPTMRVLAEATAPVTDPIGLSPKDMEYLVGGYLGTAGLWGLTLADMVVRQLGDHPSRPELKPEDYPVLRAFYRGDGPAKSTVYENDFYKLRDEAKKMVDTINNLAKESPEKAKAMRDKEKDKVAVAGPLSAASQTLSAMSKRRDQILSDRKMTPAQKREALDDLQAQRNAMVKKVMTGPMRDRITAAE